MIEIIEETLPYKTTRALFDGICHLVLRSNEVFNDSVFFSIGRLHNMDLNTVARLYRNWTKKMVKCKRIRQIETCDNSITYEII
jgi:hypothetical protein